MDCVHRHTGRISSHGKVCTEIPQIHGERACVSVYMTSVRLGYLSSGIYQVAATSGPASVAPRYQAPCISGRLAHASIVRRTGQNSYRFSPAGVTTPWMGNQFQQVRLGSQPAVRFYRHAVQHVRLHHGTSTQNVGQNPEHPGSLEITPAQIRQGSPQTFGYVHIHGHSCAKRSTTPPPNPLVGVRGMVPGDGVLVRQDFSDPDHSPIRWLGGPLLRCCRGFTECPRDRDNFIHRCLQSWMGGGGGGGQLGSRTLQGTWSPQQAEMEAEAVFLSVTRFLPQLKSRVVRLMCDNAVVVSYINKEGGTKSFRLTRLTIRLLTFCDQKGIRLVPVHLPGSCNIKADALSRVGQTLATEWAINGQLFHPVFSTWGTPVIDLFATFANRKLPVFASPFPDQRAKYVDAMSVPWSGMGMVYAFPPFKVLPAVLNKIRWSHNLSVILIAPDLMSASWMPELLEQSRCPPIPLDGHPLLTQEVWLPRGSRRDKTLPTLKSTRLATLKGLFVKLGHSRRVAERMSTNLRPSSIGCYESHWSRFVEYCRRKHLKVFEVDIHIFSKYLLHLIENERYAPSTMISHRTSIASVLRHWKYDPATDPRIRALLHNFQLARLVQRRLMPQWDLHLVLTALPPPSIYRRCE